MNRLLETKEAKDIKKYSEIYLILFVDNSITLNLLT